MILYLHIPFCDSKCNYCAFNSYTHLSQYKTKYMDSLIKQTKTYFEKHNIQTNTINSLFIGGGTPSTVSSILYEQLFNYIAKFLKDGSEITVEVNPSVKTSWLSEMTKYGVNRFSMGVQSFNEDKLKFLGRNHSYKQAIEKIEYIKKLDVKLSIDLIYDTIYDNKKLLSQDIEYVKSFELNHISAYSLIIEKNTKFENKFNYKLDNDDMAIWFSEQLIDIGLEAYEVSNFATKDKYRSRHNIGYWDKEDYLGFGSGAIGCVANKRYYNEKDVLQYIENQNIASVEIISEKEIHTEKIFLGLRSIVGVDMALISNKEKINFLLQEKKIHQKDNKIYSNDFFLADEIALYLDT